VTTRPQSRARLTSLLSSGSISAVSPVTTPSSPSPTISTTEIPISVGTPKTGRMIAGASTTGSHRRSSTGRSTRVQTKFWTTLGRRCRGSRRRRIPARRDSSTDARARESRWVQRGSRRVPAGGYYLPLPEVVPPAVAPVLPQELFARARTTIGTTSSPRRSSMRTTSSRITVWIVPSRSSSRTIATPSRISSSSPRGEHR